LKDILAVVGFPKATYMYWQKRFDRENPDKYLEDEITKIHNENKDIHISFPQRAENLPVF